MASLIQMQDAALARMAEPRTSEKRAAKNRTAAIRQYRAAALAIGYSVAEVEQQIRDVRDVHALRQAADDE